MKNEFYAVPGDTYTVEVKADGSGNVAGESDAVELTGETNRNPEVQVTTGTETDVGVLLNDPEDYDESASYSGGEAVGKATMAVMKPILPVKADGAYSPAVGDWVHGITGGVYDSVSDPTTTFPSGVVFDTTIPEFNAADMAVAFIR
jgi:hypothetical protein